MIPFAHVLLIIHFLLMMIAGAGPLLACVIEWTADSTTDSPGRRHANRLAWNSVTTLTTGGLLGFLAGLLLAITDLRDYGLVMVPLQKRILWGLGEFVFSFVLSFAYAACWSWNRHPRAIRRWTHRLLALLTSTNLLYHFPLLMIVLSSLATSDTAIPAPLDASDFRQLAWQDIPLLRAVHFAVASFAVAGSWSLANYWWTCRTSSGDNPLSQRAANTISARIALAATALQFPLGLVLLARLTPIHQHQFLGDNLLATCAIGTSILLAVAWLHVLAGVAFDQQRKYSAPLAFILATGVVALMVVAKLSVQ